MPRGLLLLALLSPALLAQPFPAELRTPIRVTAPVNAAAAGGQGSPLVAAGGDIALVVWQDARRGGYATFASRYHRDGYVLDPLGIFLGDNGFAEAVAFDGVAFKVLMRVETTRHIVTIDQTGKIIDDRQFDLPPQYGWFATSNDGGKIRFLFLTWTYTQTSSATRVAIVSADANVVARDVSLPAVSAGLVDHRWLAGSRGSEFLVLRLQWAGNGAFAKIVADRLTNDGTLIASNVTGMSMYIDRPDEVVGGRDGYVLVKQPDVANANVTTYVLDENGVFVGPTRSLPSTGIADVEWNGDRFIAAFTGAPQLGHSITQFAELKDDGWSSRQIADYVGTVSATRLAPFGNDALIVNAANRLFTSSNSDILAISVARSAFEEPKLVSWSATLQSNVQIAAGNNGYLVGWAENGPDRFVRLYVRLFSAAGQPQSDAVEIFKAEQSFSYTNLPQLHLASTGDAYAIVWSSGLSLLARRLSASGVWLDDIPVVIANSGAVAVGSNGRNVLLAFWEDGALRARTLAMSGRPDLSPAVVVEENRDVYQPAIASDGQDYFVVWSEGFRSCPFECVYPPFKMLATRLRSDATRIDATPIVLDDQGYGSSPSATFSGGKYIVAWTDRDVRGARITREGRVVEKGTLYSGPLYSTVPLLVALPDRVALFTRARRQVDVFVDTTWEATTFDATTPLDVVASLPRVTISTAPSDAYLSLSAVARDNIIAVANDQPDDAETGYVSRAFIRFFGNPARRQAVHH